MKINKLITGFCIVFFMMTILIYPASAGALIRQGSRGSDVIKIQQRLKELGYYSGSIDGIYGSGSRSAVIRFQKDTGLTQDGIVGPATMAKIFAVSASTPPPSNNGAPATTQRILQNGSRGADVTLLQNKLNSIGFNCGRADGIFGNNTKNAVMAYQRSIGWSADGIASVGLTARLFSTPASTPPPSNNGAPATTQRILQNGSRGADVTLLQNKLNNIGFNCGRADGIFGNNTKNAVMAYQRSIGWSADGIVSAGLAARLFSTTLPPPPPPPNPPAPQYQDFKPVAGSLNGKVIFLDPGHGGSDPGAVGGSLQEKNINLDMGLRLKRVLEQAGATIILTRSTDTSSSLFYRSALVNHYILEKEIVKLQTDITALNKEIAGLEAEKEKSGLENQIASANDQLAQKRTALKEATDNLPVKQGILKARTDELKLVRTQNGLSVITIAPIADIDYQNILKSSKLIELWYTLTVDPIDGDKRAVLEQETEISSAELASEIQTIKGKLNQENSPYLPIKLSIVEATSALQAYDNALQLLLMSVNQDITSIQDQIVALGKEIASKEGTLTQLNDSHTPLSNGISEHNVTINQKTILMEDYRRKAAGFQIYINNPDLSDRKDIFTPVNDKASQDVKETFDLMATEEYVKNFLFISLHVNAMPAGNTTASGAQVYYRGNDGSNFNVVPDYYTNYNTEARQQLSSGILSILTSTMGFSGKYMTPYVDNFSVLRENNLVSCLIELGFISNASDRSILSDQINREKAAGAIYQGIINYFK